MKNILPAFFLLFSITAFGQFSPDSTCFALVKGKGMVYGNDIQLVEPLTKQHYILVNNKDQYVADSVVFYQNLDGYFINNTATTFTTDDFSRRVQEGPLEIYRKCIYSDCGRINSWTFNGGAKVNYYKRYFYYKKQDTPVRKLKYKNMYKDLSDWNPSVKCLNKSRLLKNIGHLSLISGLGLFVYGTNVTNEKNAARGAKPSLSNASPFIWIGAGLFIFSFEFQIFKDNYKKRALEVYRIK